MDPQQPSDVPPPSLAPRAAALLPFAALFVVLEQLTKDDLRLLVQLKKVFNIP